MTEQATNYISIAPQEFEDNYNLDVSSYVKKYPKGGLEYIPWFGALYLMKKHYPTFTFEVETWDGKPVCYVTGDTAFVSVHIVDTATGFRSHSSHYPVMKGFNHNAEIEPDSRAINDCIQRAKVKVLAELTGIGFSLWLRQDDEIDDVSPVPTRETRRSAPPKRSAPPAQIVEDEEDFFDDESDEDYGDDEVFEDEDAKPIARRSAPPARRPAPATKPAAQPQRRAAQSRGRVLSDKPFG